VAITILDNVNYSTYGDEIRKARELTEQFTAGATSLLTTSGNVSWTSGTSGITYDTSTSSDPQILNKGTSGLLTWLNQLFSTATPSGYGASLITNTYLSNLIYGIQKSELTFAIDAGSSDAYAISLSVAPTSYVTGQQVHFVANTANTGSATLNVNGLGAKSLKDIFGNDLVTGAILSGQLVSAEYNGTDFIVTSVRGDVATLNDTQTLANKTLTSPLIRGTLDGWISANETWTYASATTITVPSGAASKYKKGDKIKITQSSTTKYFYIITVADTLLTVTGGTDYTVANSAISNNYYSHAQNPMGFPAYFNYTPTVTAASGAITSYTVNVARFSIIASDIFLNLQITITNAGTGAGDLRVTLPVNNVGYSIFAGRENAVNGKMLQGKTESNLLYIIVYDNVTSIIVTNASVLISGTYRF
jgi:hypothetical protein